MVDDPAVLGAGDIIMDGGTLEFKTSPVLSKTVDFRDATTGTITAAPGQIVVFGPGVTTEFNIGHGSTAIFGSASQTGTVVVDTDMAMAYGRVIVAGGTLTGGPALTMLLATADQTTVRSGATLDFGTGLGYVHNLSGSGRVRTGAGGEIGLIVDDGSRSEFSGVISGAGAVAVVNFGFANGTMILSGDNTYTGGTLICACTTLQLGNGGASGSIKGNVFNGGKLAFNRSDIYVFSGEIEDDGFDAGTVVQMGSGTTVLTANNTYTGDTIVAKGKLVVDGSTAGSHTYVLGGGTLGGHGVLGDVTVRAGGTHAPGNSIGTQTVSGNYRLEPGAVLEIEADGAGRSDKVIVSGTVDLTGAVLRVIAAPGGFVPGTNYIYLQGSGPPAGAPTGVSTDLAFLAVAPFAAGNTLGFGLDRNGVAFRDVTLTSNQRSVAIAVDALPDSDPLHMAVVGQTAEGARAAFDAASGEVHATLGGLLAENTELVRDTLLTRLAQAFHSGSSAPLGSGGPLTMAAAGDARRMALGAGDGSGDVPFRTPAPQAGPTFWTEAYGSWGDFESGHAAGADRAVTGFLSGVDAEIGGSWRAGLATGYDYTNASVDARASSVDVESVHFAAYAGGPWRGLAVRTGAVFSWHDVETSRAIAFPGVRELAEASYDGLTGQVFGEVALPWKLARAALEPFAGLAYVYLETDGFRETGSIAALRSRGADDDLLFSTVGVRAAATFGSGDTAFTPRLSLAWRHAIGAEAPGIALAFASNGAGFGAEGVAVAGDSLLIETGFDVAISNDAALAVTYRGQVGDDVRDHGLRGGFNWKF